MLVLFALLAILLTNITITRVITRSVPVLLRNTFAQNTVSIVLFSLVKLLKSFNEMLLCPGDDLRRTMLRQGPRQNFRSGYAFSTLLYA